jgi:hypothetical protein
VSVAAATIDVLQQQAVRTGGHRQRTPTAGPRFFATTAAERRVENARDVFDRSATRNLRRTPPTARAGMAHMSKLFNAASPTTVQRDATFRQILAYEDCRRAANCRLRLPDGQRHDAGVRGLRATSILPGFGDE